MSIECPKCESPHTEDSPTLERNDGAEVQYLYCQTCQQDFRRYPGQFWTEIDQEELQDELN